MSRNVQVSLWRVWTLAAERIPQPLEELRREKAIGGFRLAGRENVVEASDLNALKPERTAKVRPLPHGHRGDSSRGNWSGAKGYALWLPREARFEISTNFHGAS